MNQIRVAFLVALLVSLSFFLVRMQDLHQLVDGMDMSFFADMPGWNRAAVVIPGNLSDYDPTVFPVFEEMPAPLPLRVGIVTNKNKGASRHYLFGGVEESSVLEKSTVVIAKVKGNTTSMVDPSVSPSNATVWLVDGNRISPHLPFVQQLLNPNATWKVLIIDMGDRWNKEAFPHWQPHPHVRLAVRSIVSERRWLEKGPGRIQSGYIAPNTPTLGGPILHFPYAVRSDTIQMLFSLTSTSIVDALEEELFRNTVRSIDVHHPWVIEKGVKGELRNAVTQTVSSLNGTTLSVMLDDHRQQEQQTHSLTSSNTTTTTTRQLVASTSVYGQRKMAGRNSPQKDYLRALLDAKIVVVIQRDRWEDHYRLMEAMVSGAMVVADRIVACPEGLVHGESLVFFDDVSELPSLLQHYLEHDHDRRRIAQAGWRIAMTKHRAFHRLETLLFGKQLTTTSTSTTPDDT